MTPVVNEDPSPRAGRRAHDARAEPAAPPAGCGPGERPLRADAARNRERIRAAAEEVFARDGLAVPVDTVAERAGVGVGTLYRHFPTKEALFEAIVLHRLDELVALAGEEIAGTAADGDGQAAGASGAAAPGTGTAGDPTERFFAFMDRVGEQVALKHDLFDALGAAGVDLQSRCGDRASELKRRVGVLYDRAVADGGIRGDLNAEEVMQLVMGVAHRPDGTPADPEVARRLLRVVCDGLRARP